EARAAADPALWPQLQQRLSWQYPFSAATREPAKTNVSALRRRAAEQADEEAAPWRSRQRPTDYATRNARPGSPSATDIGTAHHTFLQFVALECTGSVEQLKTEAERLAAEGALSAEQTALLDFDGLAAFWRSDSGAKVRAQAAHVRRELRFTARFSPGELAQFTGEPLAANLEDEFVVVQGVADLAVLLPAEIWLLDFKTDRVGPKELAEKAEEYAPQLRLYARALSQIYSRPVTGCWLYFLARQAAVPVDIPVANAD